MRLLLSLTLFLPFFSFAKRIKVEDLNYTATCTSTALIATESLNEQGEKIVNEERIVKELETISSKEDGPYKNSLVFTHDVGPSYEFTLEFKTLQDIKVLDKKKRRRLKKQGTDKLHPFYISFRYNNAQNLTYPEDGISEFPVVMTRSPASLGGIGTNLNNKFKISENSYVYFQIYCNNLKEEKSEPVATPKNNEASVETSSET